MRQAPRGRSWLMRASSILDNRAFEFVLGRSSPGRSGVPLAGARLPVADGLQAIVRCAVVRRREKRRRLASSRATFAGRARWPLFV